MQVKYSDVRVILLTIVISIAAWISALFSGGLFVFGARLQSFADFCWIVAPVLALPIALIALWKSWVAAMAWAVLICAFFGIQIYAVWPEVTRVSDNGTKPWLFLLVQALLIASSFSVQGRQQGNAAAASGSSE
jgi:hypothetical protein